MTDNERLAAPKPSSNNLKDVIDWLKLGDVVILHHKGIALVYHNCAPSDSTAADEKVALDKFRLIYLEMSKMPSLMNEDEWPWYITNYKCKMCTCEINTLVETPEKVKVRIPHVYNFKL